MTEAIACKSSLGPFRRREHRLPAIPVDPDDFTNRALIDCDVGSREFRKVLLEREHVAREVGTIRVGTGCILCDGGDGGTGGISHWSSCIGRLRSVRGRGRGVCQGPIFPRPLHWIDVHAAHDHLPVADAGRWRGRCCRCCPASRRSRPRRQRERRSGTCASSRCTRQPRGQRMTPMPWITRSPVHTTVPRGRSNESDRRDWPRCRVRGATGRT